MMRSLLFFAALSTALAMTIGCAHSPAPVDEASAASSALTDAEKQLVNEAGEDIPLAVVENDNPEGDAFLRTPTQRVQLDDPSLPHLIARMHASLEAEQGVGIAAPQVGISRRVIIVQRLDKEGEPLEVYLNPEILEYSEERVVGWEGCLSVPAGFGEVERPVSIVLAYDGADGVRQKEAIDDWTARIFQHEVDHLDGVLFIDHMETPGLMPEEEYRAMREREREAAAAKATAKTTEEASP